MADFASPSSSKVSVLFVCLGNICRSPMAEAVFRSLSHNLPPTNPTSPSSLQLPTQPHPQISYIDSAGTLAYHADSPPDPRTVSTLSSHKITNYNHRARKITAQDFEKFDYILAMDSQNLADLKALKGRVDRKKGGAASKASVRLFGEFGGRNEPTELGEEVIDPYYGADDGFEVCFEQVSRFSKAFLREVVENGTEKEEEDAGGSQEEL
ncbi:hypothetical protein EPUS_07057 [Endocarpon pusillum Z07020]|uniref:protein-tyrosine-phosphatase n=1 Tax=Endocarpon pusillum (strain Z07020 / HMAS-L-300199) TaxID=1263415 RepID=U1GDK9_ENDPU|nr:uncharacterized protein EPUS_07057 [Endocarpon pusillum Z07020]ERF69801.1 hypothetical protein EPUS_07057 [Endocarpon pusillum Z07020]